MTFSEVWVCVDCYSVHHFGEFSEESLAFGLYSPDGPNDEESRLARAQARQDEVMAAYMELGGDRYVSDNTDSNAGYESEGCTDSCESCGEKIEYVIARSAGGVRMWSNAFKGWVHRDSGAVECNERGYEWEYARPAYDTGIDEFSWSWCHCCRSSLGGSRYRLAVEEHDEP